MRLQLALLAVLAMLAVPSSPLAGGTGAAPPAGIVLAFLLDPRLSGPTYGGEKWVSPRTYTGASGQGAVEVRAQAADALGRPVEAVPLWTASDPEMVALSASRGTRVTITVRRAGSATVIVASGEATRTLAVKADQVSGLLRLTISQ